MGRGRWKKGECGNPHGRPRKEQAYTRILEEIGEIVDQRGDDGVLISRKQALAKKIWDLALSGDKYTMAEIFNRIDGKPTERVDMDVSERVDSVTIEVVDKLIESDGKSES